MKRLLCTLMLVLLFGLGQAQGAIFSVYNTGVDAAQASLPDGTVGDPHYSLISVPDGTSSIRVRTSAGGYPIPPYLGDSPTSAWIGPNNDAALDGSAGLYTYRTTFDLTGFNPATASISGLWSSDNDGVSILLNGNLISGATSFTQFSSGYVAFASSSFFVAGINTLDFTVNNGGGPTALRVEGLTGTADRTDLVPEPASVVVWSLLGCTIAVWYRRRNVI